MSKSDSIYVRVEPEIKREAEEILSRLGITTSNAVNMFFRQIIINKGIPFELKVSNNRPTSIYDYNEDEWELEIQKALKSFDDGTSKSIEDAYSEFKDKYEL